MDFGVMGRVSSILSRNADESWVSQYRIRGKGVVGFIIAEKIESDYWTSHKGRASGRVSWAAEFVAIPAVLLRLSRTHRLRPSVSGPAFRLGTRK